MLAVMLMLLKQKRVFCLQYGGVIVDVNISDHSTVISFTDYYDGAAPALLVNHTPNATVNFSQRSALPRVNRELLMKSQ